MISASIETADAAGSVRSPGSVWSYVSPSRLNCWMSCPLKFKLRYLDGIRTPTTPALFLGKMVHAGLETFYRHRQLGVTLATEDILSRTTDAWDEAVTEENLRFKSTDEETKLKQQLAALLKAYLDQRPDDEPAPKAVEVTMETPLIDPVTGEDFGIPLLGIVDLITDEGDGLTIVDFKTSSRSGPPDNPPVLVPG
jgi:putative RecB family exonuclease